MNDDFLHRIRAEPPPRLIASLKARLTQIEKESMTRQPLWRRGFFLGSMIAATALATVAFVARNMNSPSSDNTRPILIANSPQINDPPPASAPQNTGSTTSDVVTTSQGNVPGANRSPGQLAVAASVAIYPNIKEATRFMNRNLNVYPPVPDPHLFLMSSNAVFASLCASKDSVDAAVVDRRMLPEELDACHRLSRHIAEVKIGYEAVVLARSNLYGAPTLSSRSIFLALAREIPDSIHPEELVKNPNVTWDQVDSNLPNERIGVSGPPLSAATGIAFRDLILKAGCLALPTIASLKEANPERFAEVCGAVRSNGVYRISDWSSQRAASNPFDFLGYLQANPQAIALLGFHEELLRSWNLSAGTINGVLPSPSTIHSGAYPGAHVLYLYANSSAPRMRDFVLAIWSSVVGGPWDSPFIAVDRAEQRDLRQQVLILPDLNF